jgi:peptidoglycan/xylan/chitin deacetylase (PgdA/CDA1 family)
MFLMPFSFSSIFKTFWSMLLVLGVLVTGNFIWVNSFGKNNNAVDEITSVDESSKSKFASSSTSSASSKTLSSQYSVDPKLVKTKIELPILMYHHIDTIPKVLEKDKVGISLRVSPEVFDRQIKALKDLGYNSINSFELAQYLEGHFELPSNPILLTFDDGYKDNFKNVLPTLQKYGFKGDFGIITSVIGTGEYMNWQDLESLLSAGMSISSHSVSHCTLAIKNPQDRSQFLPSKEDDSQKPCSKFSIQENLTTGQIRYELQESKKILESKLNIKVPHLIYPLGNYNPQVMNIAQESGYKFATTVRPQNDGITDFKDAFELRRIRIGGQQSGPLNVFFTSR